MTTSSPSPEPNEQAAHQDESAQVGNTDDPQLVALLDAYLDAIQQQRPELAPPLPPELLALHPELESLFDCVRELDQLVPRESSSSRSIDGAPRETESPNSADLSVYQPLDRPVSRRPAPVGSSVFQELPREFGAYTLLEQIGSGGMGIVFRAEHRTLHALVAIKLIRNREWASHDEVRRFYQEARAAAGVSHPGIVKVHDVGEFEGHHFLVMDLIEGPSFSTSLQERTLSLEQGVDTLTAVARAVSYLHERGIVHRDLKPSNILVDTAGVPHVTDFGLAKVFGAQADQTTTGTIIGTPTYMSPEQAWGETHEVTPLCDIYSLGAMLYEVIAGQPPFVEENSLDLLLRVREDEPLPPSRYRRDCPRDLEQVCLRCLEKDPARRYQSATMLADDLDRLQRHEPLQLPTVGLWRRLRKWARREPGLISRWMGQGIAAITLQGNFWINQVDPRHHWPVMAVLAVWAIVSLIAQKLRHGSGRIADAIPYFWSAMDAILFTMLVQLAAPPRGSLLVGYPLLIVAAGLWSRTRLVWFMTGACLLGFLTFHHFWHETGPSEPKWPTHYPLLVSSMLLLTGGFVAYQVHRLQVLSRYFERRR